MASKKKPGPLGWSVFQRQGETRWTLSYVVGPNRRKQHALPEAVRTRRDAKVEAERWLLEQRTHGALPMPKARSGLTLRDVAGKWMALRAKSTKLAPATVQDGNTHLTKHVLPVLGDAIAASLGTPELRAFVRALRETRAAFTVRNIVSTFRMLYDDAMSEGWVDLPSNPVRHPGVSKELPPPRAKRGKGVLFVPGADAQALLASPALPFDRRALYLLAFTSGLRDGELTGLTWADLELDVPLPLLHVSKNLALKGPKGRSTMGATKTHASERTVPLHPEAVRALRAWKDEPGGVAARLCHKPRPSDAVFPGTKGGFFRRHAARLMRSDLAAAGLATTTSGGVNLDFHATRRSFYTWLGDAGVPEDVRDQLMGHEGKSVGAKHYNAQLLGRLAAAVGLLPLCWQPVGHPVGEPVDPPTGESAKCRGGEGIRTLGTFRYGGFQNRDPQRQDDAGQDGNGDGGPALAAEGNGTTDVDGTPTRPIRRGPQGKAGRALLALRGEVEQFGAWLDRRGKEGPGQAPLEARATPDDEGAAAPLGIQSIELAEGGAS